ncbi:hypothetical protein GE061_006951 [Apolygus lucorum]|uniref:Uncharacterized protein n=1 Tax=Apolygus lucorum TaxID=248454 RepID=A0A6A4J0U9_APOLU|nr:hypothetical protein GE061_006951 [Apolygus lucorum]
MKTPNGNTKAFSTFKDILKAGFMAFNVKSPFPSLFRKFFYFGFYTTMQDSVPLAGVADSNLRMSSLTIGVIGIVIVGTSFLGFVGVNCNMKFFTGIYIICLGVSALAFIALGIYVITNVVALKHQIKLNAREKFSFYFEKPEIQDELDLIQLKYKCCGIEGNSSNLEVFDKLKPGWIPSYCCEEEIVEIKNCTKQDVFKVGCDTKLEHLLDTLCYPLAGLAFGCAVYCIVVTVLAGRVKNDE